MLKGGFETLNEWLGIATDLLKSLVVIGIVVGILFDDFFGVIEGLGRVMAQFGCRAGRTISINDTRYVVRKKVNWLIKPLYCTSIKSRCNYFLYNFISFRINIISSKT